LLLSVAAGAGGLTCGLASAETNGGADIGVATVYANNIGLVPPDQPTTNGMVLDVNPTFQLAHISSRLRGQVHYLMHAFKYLGNSDFDTTYHDGDASLAWLAIPDWFNLSGDVGYHQRIVDPKRAATSDRLFNTGNIADAASAGISPQILHRFGEVQFDALYTYGIVDYKQNATQFGGSIDPRALDSSRNQTTNVTLGTRPEEEWRRFAWSVGYHDERTHYDVALPYNYERANVLGAIGVRPSLSLLTEAGVESDLVKSTTAAGLDSSYWRAGLRWSPDRETSMQVMTGHRFFGKTYDVHLHHVRRRLDFSLGYTEEPTTEGREILLHGGPEGTVAPPPPGLNITRSTAEPFLDKLFESTVKLQGRLTSIFVRATGDERKYLFSGQADNVRGAALGLERRLGPRMIFEADAGGTRTQFRDGPTGTDKEFSVSLREQMSRTLRARLMAGYLDRSGTGVNFRAWSVSLEVRKSFGTAGVLPNFQDPLQL
jgi:hypothetical protein